MLSLFAHNIYADEFQWLEEVEGDKPLAWAEEQNQQSLAVLQSQPSYQDLFEQSLAVLNSNDRIPYVSRRGNYWYTFWQDDAHVKGIYRRTTLEEYRKQDPKWETVLDIDALAEKDGVSWVYKGMSCLWPEYELCLVNLSVGGADATVVKEFNLTTKQFVKNGFYLPEAKSNISWIDKDTLFVGTDFENEAQPLTDSGYPRLAKIWRRDTALSEAKTVYAAKKESVSVAGFAIEDSTSLETGKLHYFIQDSPSFFRTNFFYYDQGKLTQLPIPDDADIEGLFRGDLYIQLKSDWKGFKQGAVIYAPLQDVVGDKASYHLLVEPNQTRFLAGLSFGRDFVIVNWRDNVKSRLQRFTPKGNDWQITDIDFPANGSIGTSNVDFDSDAFTVTYNDFLQAPTFYLVNAKTLNKETLKSQPGMFDASNLVSLQKEAMSKDGTKVPYFIVMPKNAKLDGNNPTLLYAYGGFEISQTPSYSALNGKNWLEKGGVYVVANIRGGGEFGPAWHQAALKEKRPRAYEDFEAVAEDLIKQGITSPKHLGIRGGSNGGLLVGAAVTRRPDLYGAVVCQVPLLDMQRYNKLLAGASWMGEYGNPDIAEEWDFIKTYSPYHNVKKDAGYPRIFFTTSTRDDRVHPGHARKMVAKMKSLGHDVLYFENTEGGHAGAADNKQVANVYALIYTYLTMQLMGDGN
jgi:prolyl oligopeptidase